MDFKFTVSGRIAKPVHEVFEAVVDPKKLSGYFTTGGAQGRLETGATVTWDFTISPAHFPSRWSRSKTTSASSCAGMPMMETKPPSP